MMDESSLRSDLDIFIVGARAIAHKTEYNHVVLFALVNVDDGLMNHGAKLEVLFGSFVLFDNIW